MSLAVRSPRPDDRDRLLMWRNSPRVRSVSSTDREIRPDEHAAWFELMMSERRQQLLVVEWNGSPVGVTQLEQLDLAQGVSSWGVHLGETAVHPAVGATLPALGLALGFSRFGLRRMTAVVLSNNSNMRSMHRRLGITEEGVRREALRRDDGTVVDLHEYGVLAPEWRNIVDACAGLVPTTVRSGYVAAVESLVG